MSWNWQRFDIFSDQPALDLMPLKTPEDLDKYFVELDNAELHRQIFDLKESEEGLASLFGRKILILGEFKVGKTTLKNYIIHILKKMFKIAEITINVSNIKGVTDPEAVRLEIFRQWYTYLCTKNGTECKYFHSSLEYVMQINKLYKTLFEEDGFKNSIVILDQANQLEERTHVEMFKIFCENFQGYWEENFQSIRNRLLLICIGHRNWINEFNLEDRKSFGVFSDWILYGDNWTTANLKMVLERRIYHALKPEHKHLLSKIVTNKLVKKLEDKCSLSIFKWLEVFQGYLSDFSKQYHAYGENFANFDKFLDEAFFYQEDFDKQAENLKINKYIYSLSMFLTEEGATKFQNLCDLFDYFLKKKTVHKASLRGVLKDLKSNLDPAYIIDELTIGSKGERPDRMIAPPFITTTDNQELMLNEKILAFFEKIQDLIGQKPSQYLQKYVKGTVLPQKQHVSDIEMKSLETAQNNIAGLIDLPQKKHNRELEETIKSIDMNEPIKMWEKIQLERSQSNKNLFLIQIKKCLHSYVKKLKRFVVELYNLPNQDIDLIFSKFATLLMKQGDKFNWDFENTIEFGNPDGVRMVILDFREFTERLSSIIFTYEDANSYDQRKTIDSIKETIRAGILWISDIPAQHYFNIKAAKLYIEKNIRVENESIEQIGYFPEAYLNPADKFHSVYVKFSSSGFQPMVDPRKDKTTDVDAFLINDVTNKMKLKKYRTLIIGGADKTLVNFAKEMIDTHKGIQIFFFIQDNFQISINKMRETFGADASDTMVRYFCDHHQRIDEEHIQGKIKLDTDYLSRLEKGSVMLSYAEEGLFKKYYISKNSFEHPTFDEVSKLKHGYYLIKCRIIKKSTLKVVDLQPIDR